MPANRGIDPTVHTAALAALELAVNRTLALSPQALAELAEMDTITLRLLCTAPHVDVYISPQAQGIRLMGHYDGAITTTVRGVATDFTELAASKDPAATLINGKLSIDGNSAPLLAMQRILSTLDIDWEAPLADALGDTLGHQLAQTLRGVFRWGRQASDSLLRQLDEFIHEEARLSPPRLELEDFYRDIQELSLRTERLQSRTERLRKRIAQREQ